MEIEETAITRDQAEGGISSGFPRTLVDIGNLQRRRLLTIGRNIHVSFVEELSVFFVFSSRKVSLKPQIIL